MRTRITIIATGAIVLLGIAAISTAGAAPKGGDNGHTPTVVCHWVPAAPAGSHQIPGPDGGSYNVVVVDDDGADGNKNQRAHDHHEHDIIGSDENCGVVGGGGDDGAGED